MKLPLITNNVALFVSSLLHLFSPAIFLLLQHKTMQMMYEMIYKALKEVGLDNKYCPQDYLNFFCLGNRETPSGEDNSAAKANKKEANTPQVSPLTFLLS